jgi:hypothetical protein
MNVLNFSCEVAKRQRIYLAETKRRREKIKKHLFGFHAKAQRSKYSKELGRMLRIFYLFS